MWIVLGLGNPGREYADTRHNLGFRVADELLRRAGAKLVRGDDCRMARVLIAGQDVLIVEPTTYVNRTGRVLRHLVERPDFDLSRLLAVVDDVALPFGRLRLRPSGSAGGHNGLRSMLEVVGEAFPRLRLGVGGPSDPGTDLADHVLAPFTAAEQEELEEFVGRSADAVARILEVGVDRALPEVNAPAP